MAVLVMDPSSPFTVVRSWAIGPHQRSRAGRRRVHSFDGDTGHLGGLALATPEAVRVLDAVGCPWILIETVGVGQVEVEIAGEADTTVVVLNPGWVTRCKRTRPG